MKNKVLLVILILLCTFWAHPKENPWGNLKKIHFYDSYQDYDRVLENLEAIDFYGLRQGERKELASRLIAFGDHYFEKGKYQHARAFYEKVLELSSDYWHLYNKLEKIDRAGGGFFISFDYAFKQMFLVLKNFSASFLLVNQFLNLLFFAALLVFFLFSGILLTKYFKLACNDLVIGRDGKFAIKKALILSAIILWPIVLLAGWMIYPFLITGLLWLYLNDNERKTVKYALIIIAAVSIFYGLNTMLEENIRAPEFKRIQRVYNGHLYDKKTYQSFDDELKTIQAHSYYEYGEYNKALDILNSTGEDYTPTLKYDLLGNIYFRFGELEQSMEYYRKSLLMNDKNKIALNNFTLALLKDNDPDAIKSYAQRYPEIDVYRKKNLRLQDVKIRQGDLWKRVFNSSHPTFSAGQLLKGLIAGIVKLPVLYYLLLFILYVTALKKTAAPTLGESTYCSKCSRVIKEASVHRSYKMCDDCHQLFSIKDVIFLEAKILKEKELKKKFKKKYILSLILSMLIPGLNFNQRENNRLFVLLSIVFYFLLGIAVVGAVNYNYIYSAAPLILNFVGILAILIYLFINIFSVTGEEDGI
jgi:tetratricopeptide (TPR) repeat protein